MKVFVFTLALLFLYGVTSDVSKAKVLDETSGTYVTRGTPVEQVQHSLQQLGLLDGTIDGVIGPVTTAAILKFQEDNGLTADGFFGAQSWAMLRKLVGGDVNVNVVVPHVASTGGNHKLTGKIFEAMWLAYPMDRDHSKLGISAVDRDTLVNIIGGQINDPMIQNTCATRISYTLNSIAEKLGDPKWAIPKGRTFKCPKRYCNHGYIYTMTGNNPKGHYSIRVRELGYMLTQWLGKPNLNIVTSRLPGSTMDEKREELLKILSQHSGLVKFNVRGWGDASGHFDLWNAEVDDGERQGVKGRFGGHAYICLVSDAPHMCNDKYYRGDGYHSSVYGDDISLHSIEMWTTSEPPSANVDQGSYLNAHSPDSVDAPEL